MPEYMWLAEAEYADGTSIRQTFEYREHGVYSMEEERQYELECWLLERVESPAVWYSVTCVEAD